MSMFLIEESVRELTSYLHKRRYYSTKNVKKSQKY